MNRMIFQNFWRSREVEEGTYLVVGLLIEVYYIKIFALFKMRII